MANLKTIGFINSFIDETRKTQRDLVAIKIKKAERVQKDELFKLQKKNIESQIRVREATEEITPLDAKLEMQKFKDLLAAPEKAQSDLENAALDMAQSKTQNKQKQLGQIGRQIIPSLSITTDARGRQSSTLKFTTAKPEKVSGSDKFQQGFKQAEAGEITFNELGKQFPSKRKAIKEQRIAGLPEKSQRLLGQIQDEIKADAKAARKIDEFSNPEDVIKDFLGEIIGNREQAERAGHDVDQILDILGVTEQEVLDNQEEPEQSFLDKIKDAAGFFIPIVGAAKLGIKASKFLSQ